jgi:ectoine hydroxylase-related dioxygenase (phytanoyl-CoA dioxygenase family)
MNGANGIAETVTGTPASDGTTASAIDHCAAELAYQGYSILHDVVPHALCDEILAEMTAMAVHWPRALNQSTHGFSTERYFDLLNAAPAFQRIPVLPKLLGTMRAVLGPDCQLGTYGTSSIGPGEPAQVLHCDDGMYGLERPHKNIYCLGVVALTDFTDENGATRVMPFSHEFPDYPPIQSKREVRTRFGNDEASLQAATIAAEMPKGSVCFVLGNTWHGGGANRSAAPRPSMTITFCSGWVRPQENFLMAVAQERAATFAPELQDIIGYRTSRGQLGHIYSADEVLSGPMAHRLRHASVREMLAARGQS